jgi:hypothetical protein
MSVQAHLDLARGMSTAEIGAATSKIELSPSPRWPLASETNSRGVPRGDLGAAPVRFSDGANDCQTESGAPSGAGSIAASEAFEGVVCNGAVEALPGV